VNIQPLAIVFLWCSEDNSEVNDIVEYAASLLSRDAQKPFSRSIDIPVFYYMNGNEKNVPEKVNIRAKNILIYPFIGTNMVINKQWKEYIRELYEVNNSSIIPIALDKYAFNIGHEVSSNNFIRAYEYSTLKKEKTFIAIAHEIYRYGLNEKFSKLEIGTQSALKIFLSHAKDGENGIDIAEQLKQYLDSSALKSFFDANDIAPGYRFDSEIVQNIKESSVIAINSDVYSSRYWCQREIQVAKQYDRPILEVDVLNREMDRKFPYATNIPVVRININDGIDDEELVRILTMMLVETIRFYYAREQLGNVSVLGNSIKLCFRPPELTDIEKILVKDENSEKIKSNYEAIMYPDPPIYSEEIQYIEKLGIKVFTPLTKDDNCFKENKIGISISEILKEELINIGQNETHLIKLSQSIARYLLSREAILVYGGDLRKEGFTEYLFLEAQILKDRLKSKNINLKNYQAWPIYLNDTLEVKEWKAKYSELAQMIEVDIESDVGIDINDKEFLPPNNLKNRFVWAKSLSKMRYEMIKNCDARICAGGRKYGYKGKMPGVLEEILISIKEERPIFLLGGFGGVTQSVCELIESGIISEDLTEEWQVNNNDNYKELLQSYENYGEKIDYDEIAELIKFADLKNGLSGDENRQLFNTIFIDEAIALILRGLQNIFA